MRLVLDTNILVSAFVFNSVNARSTLQFAEKNHVDPKDNKFLELALAGNATCIITGDKDLLVLNPFRNIQIISPKEFLEQF